MASLVFPKQRIGSSWGKEGIGYFRDDEAYAHFRDAYAEGMAGLPVPQATFDVETSFGTVRCYRFGSANGTPMLLLPGRNSSTPLWASNLPGLLAHRTVYTVDLLGEAGLSVQSKRISNAADQATWLDETLVGLGLERVHLFGVSIGGWTAVNAAIHRPGRIASITVLDPAMTFARVSLKMIVVSMGTVIPFLPDWVRNRLLSWIAGGVPAPQNFPEGKLIASGMSDYTMRTAQPKLPTDEQLRSITMPALVILAGRSIVHDVAKAEQRAASTLIRGQVEVWPDASHAINGEYPDEIAERTAQFLREVDAATPT